jgi:hypothetical protein
MTVVPATWQLAGNEARLEGPLLRAKIQLDFLSHGLCDVTWSEKAAHGSAPLQLRCGADRRIESYVRGDDLISTYESIGPQGTPQVYWRLHRYDHRPTIGIEVVLSMRTDLLDGIPLSAVDTLISGATLHHAAALDVAAFVPLRSRKSARSIDNAESATHLFVLRDKSLGLSYAEMVHPTDFASVVVSNPESVVDSWHIKSMLFPERLEKGVIRRGRICGWFLPRENDLAVAVELAQQFIDEPLPLTT